MQLTRRQFCTSLVAAVPVAATGLLLIEDSVFAAARKSAKPFDLLIKGGTAVDPSQHLNGRMDIGIREGKIVELGKDLSANPAKDTISADGKIVTPGLIDIHTHVFEGAGNGTSTGGVNPDRYCLAKGVTTVVDAGSAGFADLDAFIRYIVKTSQTRIFALVDIGSLGSVGGTQKVVERLPYLNARLTAQEAIRNKPITIGIKIRCSKNVTGPNDIEGLKRALEAAEISKLPLMVHIGDGYSPLKDVLKLLRKGDVITHCYNGDPNGILDKDGRVLPEVLEARNRGIIFDVAGHLSFDVAEKAIRQDFKPDTISTDLSDHAVLGPVFDLPNTLSAFFGLGLTIDEIIAAGTSAAAKVFDYGAPVGSLRPGSVADVAVFELRQGNFEFEDIQGKKRPGNQKLFATAVIHSGKLYSPAQT